MRKVIIATLLLAPALTFAQGFGNSSRAQSWDFSLNAIYQDGNKVGGEQGSSLDLKSSWGFGFGFDYNFNEKLALGADLDFIRPDYTAVLVEDAIPPETTTINHRLSQFNGRIIGTFNMLEGPLVPYIDAGFGWTYVDSNVADGPPQTGCWWHPWFGYICSNFYSTFSSTETSYGAGLGLRYEIAGGSFVKGSYNYWKLNSGGNSDDFTLGSWRIEYGWNF